MSLARSDRWVDFRVIRRERAAFHREAQAELPRPICPRQKCLAKASFEILRRAPGDETLGRPVAAGHLRQLGSISRPCSRECAAWN